MYLMKRFKSWYLRPIFLRCWESGIFPDFIISDFQVSRKPLIKENGGEELKQ